MMKKIVVASQYLFISIPFSCQRVIESLQDKLAAVPEEYQETAKVIFEVGSEGGINVEIYYEQLEGEEEENVLDRESRKDISSVHYKVLSKKKTENPLNS